MNKQTLSVKIDVSKISKNRLYKGKKGTYLSAIILLKDEPDKYGNNGVIIEDVNKEERAAGVKGNILGNVKVVGGTTKNTGQLHVGVGPQLPLVDEDNDLPF